MNNPDDITIQAEISEMKTLLADAQNRMSKTEATLEGLVKIVAARNRATIWQLIVFAVVMAGTAFCALYFMTVRLSH